jgi:low affinity Fe/Cu permease
MKLDELIRVTEARLKLIGIERLSEPELEAMRADIELEEPNGTVGNAPETGSLHEPREH